MRKTALFICLTILVTTCGSHAQNDSALRPNHLAFFTAFRENSRNVLSWATEKTDGYTFSLEFSSDSIYFFKVRLGRIEEDKVGIYELMDSQREAVKIYYRLKVFDRKGKVVETRTIVVINLDEKIV